MLELDVLMVFIGAATALALVPGPDNIFVLTQSALYGRLSGFMVTLGLCSGLMVHSLAVAFGLAALFTASAVAFTAIKFVGAAYLVYLAWQALRASGGGLSGEAAALPTKRQLYRRGVVMNITNPKVAIFFLAFLPQFADPTAGALAPQLFGLGCVFAVVTGVVFGTIACCAGLLGEWLKGSLTAQLVLNRIAAAVFAALAVRLVLETR